MNRKLKWKNRKRLRRIVFVAFLLASSNYLFSQLTVKGRISSTEGKEVSFAQILLKRAANRPAIAFAQASFSGIYKISIPDTGKYLLEFRALSHKKHRETIQFSQTEAKTIVKNVQLVPESVSINEVIVTGRRPVEIKEDTVIYDVDAFRKGDEEVAEDVLKELPGVEVDDEGKIKFQGKEVSKVTVDGDDLFEKGYRLLTKGLNANVIDKVEALTNQTENKKLKDVERGDQTILNLVLKKDARYDIFGNAFAAGTNTGLYDASLKLMSFSKRFKFYAIGSANDMGDDPLGSIREFYNTFSFQKQEGDPLENKYREFIDIRGNKPRLSESLTTFNNSKLGSFNTIVKPTKKTKLKLVTFVMDDKQEFTQNSSTSYFLSDTTFNYREDHELNNQLQSAYSSLKFTWDINAKSNFVYDGDISYAETNAESLVQFNDSANSEVLDNNRFQTHHEFAYTNSFKEKQAFVVEAKYNKFNAPESYLTSVYNFGSLIDTFDVNTNVAQHFQHETEDMLGKVRYLAHPTDNLWFRAKAGYKYLQSAILSELKINDSLMKKSGFWNFYNDHNYKYNLLFGGVNLKYKLKKLEANLKIDYHHLTNNIADTSGIAYNNKTTQYLTPAIGLKYKFSKTSKLSLIYVYNMNPLMPADYLPGYYVSGYNALKAKSNVFGLQKNHNVMLLYNLGNFNEGRVFNLSVIYNHADEGLVSSTYVQPTYTRDRLLYQGGKEMLFSSMFLHLFIKKIYNGIKIRFNTSHSKGPYYVNGQLKNSNLFFYKSELIFKSAFLEWFNYEAGISYSQTQHLRENIDPVNEQMEYIDLFFEFKPKLRIKVMGEHYYFNNDNLTRKSWYFLNLEARYQVIPNKLKLSFEAFNLFDEKQFGSKSITEYAESSSYYRLRGRYFMLGAFYRF